MQKNQSFLKKADCLKPNLYKRTVLAKGEYGVIQKGGGALFDLGNHFVGKATVYLSCVDGVVDAPAFLKISFFETAEEMSAGKQEYTGTISPAWIQEEYVHIDSLPYVLKMSRRYACRYIKIEYIGASPCYTLSIDKITFREETSAKGELRLVGETEADKQIDRVALRTLRNCMQDVFEDGPKRDRRLWLGDLRLQALANYETYKNYDLVKRCLYLFAGTASEKGKIAGCVFTTPAVIPSCTDMFDYPLLFIPTLFEYYEASGDKETAEELFSLAIRQLEIAKEFFDENDVIYRDKNIGWCFIDWNDALDKNSCGQAVYIYAAKYALKLCEVLQKDGAWIQKEIEKKTGAAINVFYDKEKGLFVGKNGQVSYAQNAWFVLSGVLSVQENKAVLKRLEGVKDALKPVTPYTYHYYVQALFDCGEKEKALETVRKYWGGMTALGADTFFEAFDAEKPTLSPYDNTALNSRCHAWSCTPSYFYRKYN